MNIRDKRTIGEQIKSGFRLGGWILLTFGFIVFYYAPVTKGLYGYHLKGGLAAFGLLLTAGNGWMMYLKRTPGRLNSR